MASLPPQFVKVRPRRLAGGRAPPPPPPPSPLPPPRRLAALRQRLPPSALNRAARRAQVGLPFFSFILLGWLGLQQGLSAKIKEGERRKRYVEPEKPEDILAVRARRGCARALALAQQCPHAARLALAGGARSVRAPAAPSWLLSMSAQLVQAENAARKGGRRRLQNGVRAREEGRRARWHERRAPSPRARGPARVGGSTPSSTCARFAGAWH